MPAVQRESWWRVLRGLALALLLAVLLLHVAMPRVRVTPGDQLGPGQSLKPSNSPGKLHRDEPSGTEIRHAVTPEEGSPSAARNALPPDVK